MNRTQLLYQQPFSLLSGKKSSFFFFLGGGLALEGKTARHHWNPASGFYHLQQNQAAEAPEQHKHDSQSNQTGIRMCMHFKDRQGLASPFAFWQSLIPWGCRQVNTDFFL